MTQTTSLASRRAVRLDAPMQAVCRGILSMMTQVEQAKAVANLLRIARVAMPPDLFEQDIRVRHGLELLAHLEGPGNSVRVPNHPPKSHAQRLAELRPVEESSDRLSFITDLEWELVLAVTEAQQTVLPLDPSAAINLIVREWCINAGFLAPPLEDGT